MENLPLKPTSGIEELRKGREFAAQLGLLVRNSWSGDAKVAGWELIEEVLSSFSRALQVLDSGDKSTEAGRSPASDSVSTDEAKSETSGKKRKSSAVGRGGFRKRKQSSQWWTVMSKITHDEYSWRKYGQKEIQSSKFPRSYFRCTHKFDRGCTATKQVQKSEDDPSIFIITYMGQHSCKSSNIGTNLIAASNSIEPSIISFGPNTSNVKQDFSLPCSALFSKRQESDEEVLSSLTPSSPSAEIFDFPTIYEGLVALGPVAMERALPQGDESTEDMEFMVDSLSFGEDLFCFDHGDFSEIDPHSLGMNFI